MALIKEGIEKVRAFELPGGIWGDGDSVAAPRQVLVEWNSCWGDKFYQVYVNGRYAGTTLDCDQRKMVVQTPISLESPVRIEVFATEACDASIDFSDEISQPAGQSGRVRINFLRRQDLPADSTAQIYFDNGGGEIDYDNPLTDRPIRIWPAWQDKAGFGMSRFGVGDFGYESAAAAGFGCGSFGRGLFGLDADTVEWVSPVLQAGKYKFAIKITDGRGNESNSETGQITVAPAAKPAERLNVTSFDRQTNTLILGVR
jgi:hypothetical protein